MKAGEFVLGYPDEISDAPPIPQPDILGRNGSYVVFRKLHQRVAPDPGYLDDETTADSAHVPVRFGFQLLPGRLQQYLHRLVDRRREDHGHRRRREVLRRHGGRRLELGRQLARPRADVAH